MLQGQEEGGEATRRSRSLSRCSHWTCAALLFPQQRVLVLGFLGLLGPLHPRSFSFSFLLAIDDSGKYELGSNV